MKNIAFTLFLIASFSATIANAQFAFETGVNMANLNLTVDDHKVGTTFKTGAGVGIFVDFEMVGHIYFEPGLLYQMNGCKITDPPTGRYFINTITIPINFEYKSGTICNPRFLLGAGIFIGDNTSGSYDIPEYGNRPASMGELVIGSNKGATLKGMDIGAGVNIGYVFKKHLYVRANYQYGLVNLVPGGDDKNSLKTSAIGIHVGFTLSRCSSRGRGTSFGHYESNHWRGMSKGHYSRRPRPERYPR